MKKKSTRKQPKRQIVASSDTPKAYEKWLKDLPQLKLAIEEAKRRFGHLDYVHGIGIGPKYLEQKGRKDDSSASTRRMCVAILVKEKMKTKKQLDALPKTERIPKLFLVMDPKKKRKIRVLTDVIEVGDVDSDEGEENSDAWPTFGDVRSGARHTFGKFDVKDQQTGVFSNGTAALGTTGVLINVGTSKFATMAGHTVVDISSGKHEAPSESRGFGVKNQDWVRLPSTAYFPGTVKVGNRIRDALLFQIPSGLSATAGNLWPDGFKKNIANSEDILAAKNANYYIGYVWIERNGVRIKQACELLKGVDNFTRKTFAGRLEYTFVWMYKFKSADESQTTKGGDSGACVFIPSADGNEDRLLGFHFFHLRNSDIGYAVDADGFLRAVAGTPGTDFTFA